jgi:hypothetical protein
MATAVQADGPALPWNYTGESWAAAKDGIGQVDCVHTSQGLEFDWMGVLIGDDLGWRDGAVQGEPGKRAKSDQSLRGWKGEFAAAEGDPAAAPRFLFRGVLISRIAANTS